MKRREGLRKKGLTVCALKERLTFSLSFGRLWLLWAKRVGDVGAAIAASGDVVCLVVATAALPLALLGARLLGGGVEDG